MSGNQLKVYEWKPTKGSRTKTNHRFRNANQPKVQRFINGKQPKVQEWKPTIGSVIETNQRFRNIN